MTIWFAHCFVPGPGYGLLCPVLSSRARACRRDHRTPSAPLPDVGVAFVREFAIAQCHLLVDRRQRFKNLPEIPHGELCAVTEDGNYRIVRKIRHGGRRRCWRSRRGLRPDGAETCEGE